MTASRFFTGLTATATYLIIGIFILILGHIAWEGRAGFSFRFLSTGLEADPMDPRSAGVLPMIIGTVSRVFLMTLFVMPAGVITAVYLHEYAHLNSSFSRLIRAAVNCLAGVPSIVFGLFGLGFFIAFVGGTIDEWTGDPRSEPHWGKPGLLWASLTLAVMTLPVVIIATDEAIRAIPNGQREASLALGATPLQTVFHVVLPQALPGILTGGILGVSRAAGEVAPILFTGAAYYMAHLPSSLTDQFMDLGYHAFVLATQNPNSEATRPVLYATILTLLVLTLALNAVALFIRARVRRGTLPANST